MTEQNEAQSELKNLSRKELRARQLAEQRIHIETVDEAQAVTGIIFSAKQREEIAKGGLEAVVHVSEEERRERAEIERSLEAPATDENGNPLTRRQMREWVQAEVDRIYAQRHPEGPAKEGTSGEDSEPAAESKKPEKDTGRFKRFAKLGKSAKKSGAQEGENDSEGGAESAAGSDAKSVPEGAASAVTENEARSESAKRDTEALEQEADAEAARSDAVKEAQSAGEGREIEDTKTEGEVGEESTENASPDDAEQAPAPPKVAAQSPVEKASEQKNTSGGYSFPDIAPLDDSPVFDPSSRSKNLSAAYDFNSFVANAVAEESASLSGINGTAALILPEMPKSDSLVGSLGETGEVYMTGSIQLPKSLSETGGYNLTFDLISEEEEKQLMKGFIEEPKAAGLAPVSAVRAVSAQHDMSQPVGEVKETNKKPVVFAIVGGVFVAAVIGIALWAVFGGALR